MNIFLSWSGNTSHEVAVCINTWLQLIFRDKVNIFFSPDDIDSGRKWFFEIEKKLKVTNFGILCITSDNLNSPWINFEAGAIAKGLRTSKICPVLVNVDREALRKHPLDFSQSSLLLNKGDMKKLLQSVCNELEAKDKDRIEKLIGDEFEKSWWPNFKVNAEKVLAEQSRKNTLWTDPVCAILHKHKIDPIEASQQYGIVTPIPERFFHEIRREIVGLATDSLVLVGSSLNEAFDSSNPTTDITNVIEERISSCRAEEFKLHILLSEPKIFDEQRPHSGNELSTKSPIGRLGRTLEELFDIAKKASTKLQLSIYFIPLLQLDHVVMVDEIMIIRNTMLWDSKGEYKGSWMLCRRVEDRNSMYKAYARYIDSIKTNSIQVVHDNFSRTFDSSHVSLTAAEHFTEKWRKAFFRIDKGRNKIRIYKLYREQLISVLHSSWESRHRSYSPDIHVNEASDVFKPGMTISNRNQLFENTLALGDSTQQTLLPYIQTTEKLMNTLIQRYDADGFAEVYPSFDLGIPNNVHRLAGGFATGMLVLWRCGTPIVPVDATVNICSSSIYEISEVDASRFSHENINSTLVVAHKEGVLGNFSSGNHFLSLCRNAQNRYFLVLHSSAKEFKYSAIGLYPHKSSWFNRSLRTIYSEDGSRYIRYIKGEDALHFISIARSLPEYNESIHDWFASSIAAALDSAVISKSSVNHHYCMPTSYSIAIGTFVENPGATVPIFSRPGKPIYIFRTRKEQPWSIRLGGLDKILIPHGWGHSIRGDLSLMIRDKTELMINGIAHRIEEKTAVMNDKLGIGIRDFDTLNGSENAFFEKLKHFVNGEVVDRLHQMATYSKGKIVRYGK